jgi:ADP-ribose pyrophosphatase YjhB (NUDIX family)
VKVSDWRHCPRCAGALVLDDATDDVHVRCPACGFFKYDNPLPTSVVVLLDEQDRALLVRRAVDPRAGHWDTVGGFVNLGETAEECARREVHEELGARIEDLTPLGTFVSVYGDESRQTLASAFTARLAPGAAIALSQENLEAAWCDLDALPDDLAFPDGEGALRAARDRRRLFHVTPRAEFDPAADEHRPAGFAAEGFVHLATAPQLDGVLERYYAGVDGLLVLTIDRQRLTDLRWEPGAGAAPGPFPHLYGPLPRAAIVEVAAIPAP